MKNHFQLSLGLFLLLTFQSTAQNTFQKGFGGSGTNIGNAVQQTADSGFIAVGYTSGFGAGAYDIFVIRTDKFGAPIWKKAIGSTGSDYGYDVQQTSDGGFIVAGNTDGNSGPGLSGDNVCLIKINSGGTVLWSNIIGSTGDDMANSVRQTTDGGYIVAGSTNSFGAGNKDFYVVKTNAMGYISWTKTFGGAGDDVANSIKQTSDGGYIIVGESNSFGTTNIDYYLVKISANGNYSWSKTYSGNNDDWVYSVLQTTDGGYMLAGYSISFFGAGEADAVLMKTDSLGTLTWAKTYGNQYGDVATSIQQTNDNGYIVVGGQSTIPFNMVDEGLIFKIDSVGNFLWANTFINENDVLRSVYPTFDNGFIMAGDRIPVTGSDISLIKANANGISGCNESPVTLVSTDIFPQVSSPLTSNATGGTGITGALSESVVGTVSNICANTSIYELSPNNPFLISPNPASEHTLITFLNKNHESEITIYNTLGGKVYFEKIINETQKEINLSKFSSGVYFMQVFDGENNYCKKLIVEKN